MTSCLAAWWVTLLNVAVVTAVWGDTPLVWIATNWGPLLTCASLTGDVAAVAGPVTRLVFHIFPSWHLQFLSKLYQGTHLPRPPSCHVLRKV